MMIIIIIIIIIIKYNSSNNNSKLFTIYKRSDINTPISSKCIYQIVIRKNNDFI